MANHLTPTELAQETGLDRQEVLERCMELSVPVYHGRIDKTLFAASMQEVRPGAGRFAREPGRAGQRVGVT